MIGSAAGIQFTEKKISLQGPFGCGRAGEREHGLEQLLGSVEPHMFVYVAEFQIGLQPENSLPGFQVSRYVRLSVGFKPRASHQKQEARIGAQDSGNSVWQNVFASKRLIVMTHVTRFGEVRLLNLAHTAQGVEVGSQPSPVLGE